MAINLVQGDTAPNIKATITRSDTGSAVDLSGATVVLRFRKKRTSNVLFTMSCTSDSDDLASGICNFSFSSGQLDVPEGEYEGEIEVTYSDSTIETVYEIVDFYVREDFN